MINVLADKYIYKLEQFLPEKTALTLYDPQEPFGKIPSGTQALFTRTTIKVNDSLISQFPDSLKFVATASAGTDHVDIPALHKKDIVFSNAAGCNARAVAEYVATALLIWTDKKKFNLQNLIVGIVGVGNTGGETNKLLQSLGIKTVAYDPPREARDAPFKSASLNEVLHCDVLTFHVPLTFNNKFATYHWLDDEKLDHHFKLIINASRGGVVDEKALFNAFQKKRVDDYILDVWENEPIFNDEVAKSAFIHTPHIAGYSIQAKLRASKMVAEAFCEFFNLKMPTQRESKAKVASTISQDSTLSEILRQLHSIGGYHQKFSNLIDTPADIKTMGFSRIRTHHALRDEYRLLEIPDGIKKKFEVLNRLTS